MLWLRGRGNSLGSRPLSMGEGSFNPAVKIVYRMQLLLRKRDSRSRLIAYTLGLSVEWRSIDTMEQKGRYVVAGVGLYSHPEPSCSVVV